MTFTQTISTAIATLVTVAFSLANPEITRAEKPTAMPMIVAHRGASHAAPENTIAAFELAWRENADAIEGDFYLTADNQIVCVHDKTTARTAPDHPSMDVAQSTLAELQTLDVGKWKDARYAGEKIPTLAEVLACIPDGKSIFVEIKCGIEILPTLKQQLAESSLKPEQITIISFQADVIEQARATMPYTANWLTSYKKATLSRKWKPDVESIVQTLRKTNASGFGTQAKADLLAGPMDAAFVDTIRRTGCGLHAWTVDDADVAKRLVELGFESITTNQPAKIRAALQ